MYLLYHRNPFYRRTMHVYGHRKDDSMLNPHLSGTFDKDATRHS